MPVTGLALLNTTIKALGAIVLLGLGGCAEMGDAWQSAGRDVGAFFETSPFIADGEYRGR